MDSYSRKYLIAKMDSALHIAKSIFSPSHIIIFILSTGHMYVGKTIFILFLYRFCLYKGWKYGLLTQSNAYSTLC
jgi:hypothetical protein